MRLFGFDHHKNRDPWAGAPAWDVEIREMLATIIENQEFEMSQADDLNNAVTSLATAFAAEHDAVQTEIAAVLKGFATMPAPADPAVAAAITNALANITHITGAMATDAAALTAAIPAATTVAPPIVATPVAPPTVEPPSIATPPVTDPNAQPPNTPPPSATTT